MVNFLEGNDLNDTNAYQKNIFLVLMILDNLEYLP